MSSIATSTSATTASMRRSAKPRYSLGRVLLIMGALFFTFISFAPFAFAFITSFKTQIASTDGRR